MVILHTINLTVTLISCVTLLLNLAIQIWKFNLKYPGSSQPTHRHSNCKTTTNRQKEYRFILMNSPNTNRILGHHEYAGQYGPYHLKACHVTAILLVFQSTFNPYWIIILIMIPLINRTIQINRAHLEYYVRAKPYQSIPSCILPTSFMNSIQSLLSYHLIHLIW